MPVTIRPATVSDVSAILALERGTSTAAHWSAEEYRKLVSDDVVLVAELAGALSGFMCVRAVAGEWEIENVVVAAESRRRGIAGALIRELLQRAAVASISTILLEVRESNLPARRLYEKHGFCEEGRRRAYYRDPVQDAVLYALRSR